MGEPTKVYIDVDRCNQARHLQLAIGDSNGGYRLAGPGYMGNSTNLLRCRVDERDAVEVRRYLDKAWPDPRLAARDAVIRRLLGEWEPVLPGDALAEYVDGEVYDDDAPAPCWVQFDTYDERAEKPSEPMTEDEAAVVRAAREAEARG